MFAGGHTMPARLFGAGLSESERGKVIELCIENDPVCDAVALPIPRFEEHSNLVYGTWVRDRLSRLRPA